MKRHLLPLLLLAGVACLPAHRALAQDKPVLNSAPPGPTPAPPRPVEPAPAPTPAPSAPASAPAPEPTYSTPAAQPTPDAPSGMNFPNRNLPQNGSKEDQPQKKKFIYTNIGLGYSSYDFLNRFNVSAAPALGFRITDKFAIGPGISYAYSSFSVAGNRPYPYTPDGNLTSTGANSLSTSSLGFKAFAQYIVYKEFFIHAEYEVTNAQIAFEGPNNYLFKQNRTVTSPLAGVGYRSYLSDNAAIDIVGLYNFDNSIYSLYPGFVLRFSLLFNIGK
ncbi:hypothetical protein [Hymenobacter terricola]|uniref:hypothetical protein n=1 Tax=Hymenobacter terricola TaxID=2819236 RepID=UPI001B30B347|nr:hypothetical protein [Hymenobacter terricola]